MAARYDIKPHRDSWMVIDTSTGSPASINGVWQVGLPLEDADDLADLLNHLHTEALAAYYTLKADLVAPSNTRRG
jgi:hypothetical protein